jgi:hypothetical protein
MEMAEKKQCQNGLWFFFLKSFISSGYTKQIEIVPNGILYNFQLQKVGI